ncbi:MAG: CvpA family protein [Flavipsychrobacter sp.]
MLLDIITITIIIAFFIRGYMKGIIIAAFSVLALILGTLAALRLSERLATYLLEEDIVTSGWSQIVSYIILFVGVVIIVRMIAKALDATLKAAMLGWLNKTIGGLLYAAMGAVVWSALLWLGTEIHFITPQHISESSTYAYIRPIAPWIADKVGYLIPMIKNVFGDLEVFFSKVNQILPEHVDTP